MRITLANPRGFCAGVNMAVDMIDRLLDAMETDEQLYVYHEIVHNKHVIHRFEERGAIFVDSIEDIPTDSVVVFSAHGVSPAIWEAAENRNLTAIDATCPLVTKVHAEAKRYAQQGKQILLIGHRNHQEVVGTKGEAPDCTQVVESLEDIPKLQIDDPDNLVYLTQTTLSTDDANRIIEALKDAFPAIKSPPSDDICYATTNRQKAVNESAADVDLVLVIGSDNSSNSIRLTEIAQTLGTPAYLLDDVSQLNTQWLENVNSLLITSGASAPERFVTELIDHLVEHHEGEFIQTPVVDEGMFFSMPQSLQTFIDSRNVTVQGQDQ